MFIIDIEKNRKFRFRKGQKVSYDYREGEVFKVTNKIRFLGDCDRYDIQNVETGEKLYSVRNKDLTKS